MQEDRKKWLAAGVAGVIALVIGLKMMADVDGAFLFNQPSWVLGIFEVRPGKFLVKLYYLSGFISAGGLICACVCGYHVFKVPDLAARSDDFRI